VNNPAPVLTSFSPAHTPAGGGTFTLTVNGSGFIPNSVVYWGSTALPTTFVSNSQLTAQLAATSIGNSGGFYVTVQNPAPGGGTSNSLQFEVDSKGANAPVFSTTTITLTHGGSATVGVALDAGARDVEVTCLNLPAGSSCSYSPSTRQVTITTSATTPPGSYVITIVFLEVLPGAATSLILGPLFLLPLLRLRKGNAERPRWVTLCLVLGVLAATVFSIGCAGGQSHNVTTSGNVTMVVQ